MKTFKAYWLWLALAAVFGTSLIWVEQENGRRRREHIRLGVALEEARHQTAKANQPTSALETDPDEDRAQAADLRARIENLKAELNRPFSPVASAPPPKPAEERWKNLGLATPDHTLKSVIWAATGGEVETLATMLTYDTASREAAEALFGGLSPEARKYFPNAEKLITALVANRVPTDLQKALLVGESYDRPDEAVASFRLQRPGKDGVQMKDQTFRFRRIDADWKLIVPKTVVEDFQRALDAK